MRLQKRDGWSKGDWWRVDQGKGGQQRMQNIIRDCIVGIFRGRIFRRYRIRGPVYEF